MKKQINLKYSRIQYVGIRYKLTKCENYFDFSNNNIGKNLFYKNKKGNTENLGRIISADKHIDQVYVKNNNNYPIIKIHTSKGYIELLCDFNNESLLYFIGNNKNKLLIREYVQYITYDIDNIVITKETI